MKKEPPKDEGRKIGRYYMVDATLDIAMKEFCAKTGRTLSFVVEHGIHLAMETDCRYSSMPLVPLVASGEIYHVPEPVARALEALMEQKGRK